MNEYLAHISADDRKQTVEEHLRAVAVITSDRLSHVGLRSLGYLTGLVHDLGKYTDKFNKYIHSAAAGEDVKKGSVNHTFAGVIFFWERFHNTQDKYAALLCELICCAIGSHHGLFDCIDPDGKSGFLYRLQKDRSELEYNEAADRFIHLCAGYDEIDKLFEEALQELKATIPAIVNKCFYFSALERLITSALIDADRSDTANFMLNRTENELTLCSIAESAFDNLENRLVGFAADSPVQKSRKAFSDLCLSFAEKPGGVYKLSLPTGAGKTLASLRFALAKAANDPKGIKRILYVAPLLTVLEQNAGEIRESVGNPDWVLEHHSNVVFDTDKKDELARYELLAENWSAPIIVTTLVQLLNTLFSGKTTCIRRMRALCGSIIIIDEVQSLPLKTLSIFNGMINFLTKVCKATVVLCSATQPELGDANIKLKLETGTDADIVPYDEALWAPFDRTEIINACTPYGMDAEELSRLAIEQLSEINSVLLICNTRKTAADVYSSTKRYAPEGTEVIHLSAAMCKKHRCDCLDRLKKAIDPASGKKTICVSTQLIEAGVDISFGCVIRTLAGLDSIAQAAGRCNRHGELMIEGKPAQGKVMIVRCKDENVTFLKEIRQAQQACDALLNDFAKTPAAFDDSLLSAKAVKKYYSKLFLEIKKDNAKIMEYPLKANGFFYSITAYEMLSDNNEDLMNFAHNDIMLIKQRMRQSFKTVGDCFEVFDEGSRSVIVPYDETAVKTIEELSAIDADFDIAKAKQLIENAKPYTVSVYEGMLQRLKKAGAIISCCKDSVLAVNPYMPEIYDKETGLTAPKSGGNAYYS